jgi:hypothetical protein
VLIDSKAKITIILSRIVEEISIPYYNKKILIEVSLIERNLIGYKLGTL